MADEPQKKTFKEMFEGSFPQFVGTNIAGLYVINEASKEPSHVFQAGFEVYLAGTISIVCYFLYWLLKPRIIKWRGRDEA